MHRCDRAWWLAAEPEPEPELQSGVSCTRDAAQKGTASVWEQWGSHIWTEVTARQVVAIDVAIRAACKAGCRWLLHIDVDEAFCCGGLQPSTSGQQPNPRGAATQFFQRLPAALDQVTFLNHEAAPETSTVDDWFKECTLFKRSPSSGGNSRHFVAYTNGKSAVRLAPGVVPAGPHRFTSVPPARRLQSIAVSDRVVSAESEPQLSPSEQQPPPQQQQDEEEKDVVQEEEEEEEEEQHQEEEAEPHDNGNFCYPVLLHYPNCGFEEWRRKYKSLGTFNDSFCGKAGQSENANAHLLRYWPFMLKMIILPRQARANHLVETKARFLQTFRSSFICGPGTCCRPTVIEGASLRIPPRVGYRRRHSVENPARVGLPLLRLWLQQVKQAQVMQVMQVIQVQVPVLPRRGAVMVAKTGD